MRRWLLPVFAATALCGAGRAGDIGYVGWGRIDGAVETELDTRDLVDLAAGLLDTPPSTNTAEILRRLDISVRAGLTEDALAMVDALTSSRPAMEKHELLSVASYLIDRRDWAVARRVLERFPQVEHGGVPKMIEAWLNTGTAPEEIDRWLEARAVGNFPFWTLHRVKLRLRLGTQGQLLDALLAAVKVEPTNAAKAILYLDALAAADAASRAERPVSWMGDLCKPVSAGACYELGTKLYARGEVRAACAIFERSMTLPFTEDDARRVVHQRVQIKAEKERDIRRWVRRSLIECYSRTGKSDEAAKLAAQLQKEEEIGDSLDPDRVRRAAEAAPTSAPTTGTAREKENASSDSPQYWLSRAAYYRGRNESGDAEAAFKKALESAPFEPYRRRFKSPSPIRVQILDAYSAYLQQRSRETDAIALLRKELSVAPPDSETGGTALLRLLDMDRERRLSGRRRTSRPAVHPPADSEERRAIAWDDPLLWTWLGGRVVWDVQEELVLSRALGVVPAERRNDFWQKAEALARGTDPSRAAVLGTLMTREHETDRAIPLLKDAIPRLRVDSGNVGGSVFAHACVAFFEACVSTNDWREAEQVFSDAYGHAMAPHKGSQYGRIAVAAARAGDRADAVRLWKRRANLDLVASLDELRLLVDNELREPLREYYAGIGKRLPASCVPARALDLLEDAGPHP